MRYLIATITLLGLGTLEAQDATSFSWAQVQAAHLRQENSECLDNSLGLGLGLGHWTTRYPRFGWEVNFLQTDIKGFSGLWKAGEQHLDGSILYRPWLSKGIWIPFLRAGAGASRMESPLSLSGETSTRMNFQAAMGSQILLGERMLGSLELRGTSIRTSEIRSEVALLVGLGVRWGATEAPRQVPPAPQASAPIAPAPATLVPPPPPPVEPPPPPAPEPAPQPTPALPAAPTPAPDKIVLDEAVLHFPNNGDALGEEARHAIREVAERLKGFQGVYAIVVSGHTSSLGPLAHNKTLSLRRAKAVAKVLVDSGIPANRITTLGKGPDEPIADNTTREGQSRNRRVEIDLVTPGAVTKTRKETSTVDGTLPRPSQKKPSR